MPAGNAAEDHAARETMLREAALRFTRAIEARDHLAAQVQDLAVGVGVRRLRIPFLARRRIGIEDRPDWTAAVKLRRIAVPGHGRRKEAVGAVDLVPETLAVLVHENDVLPILHGEAGRLGEREH